MQLVLPSIGHAIPLVFGDWTILERRPRSKNGQTMALARCKCGTEKVIRVGHSQNCNFCSVNLKRTHLKIRESYIGRHVGQLEIMAYLGLRKKNPYYRCRCDCGAVVAVTATRLLRHDNPKTHCGCISRAQRDARDALQNLVCLCGRAAFFFQRAVHIEEL